MLWEKHNDEIDYVNLGYLPQTTTIQSHKSDDTLFWDLYCKDGNVWVHTRIRPAEFSQWKQQIDLLFTLISSGPQK